MNVTLVSKTPYLTAHFKINYKTGCIRKISEKHRDASWDIVTAKMELFVALVSSFQSLNNFTKKPNVGAMGVLNAPLEHYNLF